MSLYRRFSSLMHTLQASSQLLRSSCSRNEDPPSYFHGTCSRENSCEDPLTGRWVRKVSLSQFANLKIKNPVVFDLCPARRSIPAWILEASVMPIRADEVAEVLTWLPDDQVAALLGASEMSVQMIQDFGLARGSGPLYLLDEKGARENAA